jgi:hypothetical protein
MHSATVSLIKCASVFVVLQAVCALKGITITKATVLEPVPELHRSVLKKEEHQKPGLPHQPDMTPSRKAHENQPLKCGPQEGCENEEDDANMVAVFDAPAGGGHRSQGALGDGNGQESAMHGELVHGIDAHTQPADAVTEDARMQVVFDHERAPHSDEHLKHVTEQCVSSTSLILHCLLQQR